MFSKYGKPLAAVVFAALTVAYAALSDHRIAPDEGVQIAIAVATAVGVYLVPLVPQYRWAKTAVGVVLAVLSVATTLIVGGIDSSDWIALALAGLTAVGVAVTPAVSDNGISSKNPRASVRPL